MVRASGILAAVANLEAEAASVLVVVAQDEVDLLDRPLPQFQGSQPGFSSSQGKERSISFKGKKQIASTNPNISQMFVNNISTGILYIYIKKLLHFK